MPLSKIIALIVMVIAISGLNLSAKLNVEHSITINKQSSLNITKEQNKPENAEHHDNHIKHKHDRAEIEKLRLKKLAYIANYFGISADGKTIEQLKIEIEAAKKNQPEKWALLKKELQQMKMPEQKTTPQVK